MCRFVFVAVLLMVFTSVGFAGCLDDVAHFADKICGEIQTTGSRQLTEVNGQLKAEVSGIVRRVLGNTGGDIDAKHLGEAYENVLREDLAKELFNVRECRIKMVEIGRAEACKSVVPPPAPPSRDQPASASESSTFRMEGGTTRFITPDEIILSMIGTPCGANSSFVCILVGGVRYNLTLGKQVDVTYSHGQCHLTLIEIVKGKNAARFHLRC